MSPRAIASPRRTTPQQTDINPGPQSAEPRILAAVALWSALVGLALPAIVFGHIASRELPAGKGTRKQMAEVAAVIGYVEIIGAALLLLAIW